MKVTRILYRCDVGGEDLGEDLEKIERVEFGVDNQLFLLEGCSAHADEARTMLKGLTEKAQMVGRYSTFTTITSLPTAGPPTKRRAQTTPAMSREDLAIVRSWARENGYEVSDRGRISGSIIEAWAQNKTAERPRKRGAKTRA